MDGSRGNRNLRGLTSIHIQVSIESKYFPWATALQTLLVKIQNLTEQSFGLTINESLGARLQKVRGRCIPCIMFGYLPEETTHLHWSCPSESSDIDLRNRIWEIDCERLSCCLKWRMPLKIWSKPSVPV